MDSNVKALRAARRRLKAFQGLKKACQELGFSLKEVQNSSLYLVGFHDIVIVAHEVLTEVPAPAEEESQSK